MARPPAASQQRDVVAMSAWIRVPACAAIDAIAGNMRHVVSIRAVLPNFVWSSGAGALWEVLVGGGVCFTFVVVGQRQAPARLRNQQRRRPLKAAAFSGGTLHIHANQAPACVVPVPRYGSSNPAGGTRQ